MPGGPSTVERQAPKAPSTAQADHAKLLMQLKRAAVNLQIQVQVLRRERADLTQKLAERDEQLGHMARTVQELSERVRTLEDAPHGQQQDQGISRRVFVAFVAGGTILMSALSFALAWTLKGENTGNETSQSAAAAASQNQLGDPGLVIGVVGAGVAVLVLAVLLVYLIHVQNKTSYGQEGKETYEQHGEEYEGSDEDLEDTLGELDNLVEKANNGPPA